MHVHRTRYRPTSRCRTPHRCSQETHRTPEDRGPFRSFGSLILVVHRGKCRECRGAVENCEGARGGSDHGRRDERGYVGETAFDRGSAAGNGALEEGELWAE